MLLKWREEVFDKLPENLKEKIRETKEKESRMSVSDVAKTYNVDFVFSDEVFNIIRENKFDFAQLGITTIKGKSQPLSIYTCTKKQTGVKND